MPTGRQVLPEGLQESGPSQWVRRQSPVVTGYSKSSPLEANHWSCVHSETQLESPPLSDLRQWYRQQTNFFMVKHGLKCTAR